MNAEAEDKEKHTVKLSPMMRAGTRARRLALGLVLAASIGAIANAAPAGASAALASPAARHHAVPARARTGVALQTRIVINWASNTCLDANPTAWYNDPGRPWMWPCNKLVQQDWFAPGWDANGFYSEIRVIGPPYGPANKCLDAWPEPGYPYNMRVTTWTCNGGDQQEWFKIPIISGDGTGSSEIANKKWPGCLYAAGPVGFKGAYIGLEPCDSTNLWQDWSV